MLVGLCLDLLVGKNKPGLRTCTPPALQGHQFTAATEHSLPLFGIIRVICFMYMGAFV